MIVKTIDDIRGTKGEVKTQSWSSYRLLHNEEIPVYVNCAQMRE